MTTLDTTNLGDLSGIMLALGVLFGAAIAYGKIVGPHQTELTQTVIETFGVPKRYRRLANLAVGLVLAVALFAVAAYSTGLWVLVIPGITAGFLSSVTAGAKHDAETTA